uniref:Uncharacterized protein n=1 Tax=Oryza glumipatula TaxID=40148 RepID=A0A0D9ZP12_9ORYZ
MRRRGGRWPATRALGRHLMGLERDTGRSIPTKSSKPFREDPPSATDARTASPSSFARRRIVIPFSGSIASSMTSWMASAGTTSLCFSHGLTRRPALRYLHTSSASHGWSECMGHARIGFP